MTGDFIAFGNEELDDSPPLNEGEMILCPHCGDGHVVEAGTDAKTGEPSSMVLFYKCGEGTYLAGLDGKNIMRRFMK